MQSKHLFRLVLVTGLTLSATAQAALYDRGGGLIYDDDRNITWLADANYAKTSGYDTDGRMYWSTANTWAANLSYFDSVRNVTYDDWRLPTSLNTDGTGPCAAYNCTGSEMGHLHFTEGGLTPDASQPISASTVLDDYFINMQSLFYWSSTEALNSSGNPTGYAWGFSTLYGGQATVLTSGQFYAWAVRDGDVAAIPEPEAWMMLLAGLGLVGVAVKRRQRVGS